MFYSTKNKIGNILTNYSKCSIFSHTRFIYFFIFYHSLNSYFLQAVFVHHSNDVYLCNLFFLKGDVFSFFFFCSVYSRGQSNRPLIGAWHLFGSRFPWKEIHLNVVNKTFTQKSFYNLFHQVTPKKKI